MYVNGLWNSFLLKRKFLNVVVGETLQDSLQETKYHTYSSDDDIDKVKD